MTKKISELPGADALADADLFEVAQSGVSKKVTAALIRAGMLPSSDYITIPGALEAPGGIVVNPGGVGKTFYSSHALTSVGEGAFSLAAQDYNGLTHTFKVGPAGDIDALVLNADGSITLPGLSAALAAQGVGALPWSLATTYAIGMCAVDRGGIWQCLIAHTNSQPISGNVNWRLVGGVPYVDVLLAPPDIAGALFNDPSFVGTGFPGVPAPGASQWLRLVDLVSTTSPGTIGWGAGNLLLQALLVPPSGQRYPLLVAAMQTGLDVSGPNQVISAVGDTVKTSSPANLLLFDEQNQPNSEITNGAINLFANSDPTVSGTVFGDSSLSVRLYYRIEALKTTFVSYFVITALNQGSKTFTVSGDASALTTSITVVGSTGNDATYTIVSVTRVATQTDTITGLDQGAKTVTVAGDQSAVYLQGRGVRIAGSTGNNGTYNVTSANFDTDHTDITVVQALPNATADGTIEFDHTDIVVVEAIADATGDGWVKQ